MSQYKKSKGPKAPAPTGNASVVSAPPRGSVAPNRPAATTGPAASPQVPAARAESRPGSDDWLQPAFNIGKGTLQQQRAAFALRHVQALAGRADGKRQKQLNSYAAKMPFMVHANGLGQTAAFYRAKGEKDPHHDLYRLLGAWLTRPDQPFSGSADLLAGIVAADLHTYVAAQAEAMLFLGWVKQFAAAFLESE